jgi:hypothetical protein
VVAIALLVYKFFQKTPVNLIENTRKDIINAGTLCKPPFLHHLYLTGDRGHSEMKIGKIMGYCQIQSYQKAEKGEARDEDCFIFKKFMFPLSLFERAKVFRCFPEEHTQLIGDVKIRAITPVLKFGYYFPSHSFLDIERIDESIVKEASRGLIHEVMKDLVSITQKASGMDSSHEKSLEQRKLLKIPTELSQRQERGD